MTPLRRCGCRKVWIQVMLLFYIGPAMGDVLGEEAAFPIVSVGGTVTSLQFNTKRKVAVISAIEPATLLHLYVVAIDERRIIAEKRVADSVGAVSGISPSGERLAVIYVPIAASTSEPPAIDPRCMIVAASGEMETFSSESMRANELSDVFFSEERPFAVGFPGAKLLVRDLLSGEIVAQFQSGIIGASFSPVAADAAVSTIVSAEHRLSNDVFHVRRWSLNRDESSDGYLSDVGGVRSIAMSRDGKTFFSGTSRGCVHKWTVAHEGRMQGHALVSTGEDSLGAVLQIAISSSAHRVAGRFEHRVLIWDVTTDKVVMSLAGSCDSIAFADGDSLLVARNTQDRGNTIEIVSAQEIIPLKSGPELELE